MPGPACARASIAREVYLMWHVRQSRLPRPFTSLPLILTMMPLLGAEPTILCASWQDEHCILPFTSRASLIDLPVRLVPDQDGGTGALFTVRRVFVSPILYVSGFSRPRSSAANAAS